MEEINRSLAILIIVGPEYPNQLVPNYNFLIHAFIEQYLKNLRSDYCHGDVVLQSEYLKSLVLHGKVSDEKERIFMHQKKIRKKRLVSSFS